MLRAFTVYDSKAEAYKEPVFLQTKGLFLRAVVDAAQKEGHDFNRYAEDYHLFEIGTWDEQKGIMKMHEVRETLGCVLEFLQDSRTSKTDRSDSRPLESIKETSEEVVENAVQ